MWNSYIFIQENAYENVVWKKAAILSRPQYVNSLSFLSCLIFLTNPHILFFYNATYLQTDRPTPARHINVIAWGDYVENNSLSNFKDID